LHFEFSLILVIFGDRGEVNMLYGRHYSKIKLFSVPIVGLN